MSLLGPNAEETRVSAIILMFPKRSLETLFLIWCIISTFFSGLYFCFGQLAFFLHFSGLLKGLERRYTFFVNGYGNAIKWLQPFINK